MNVSIREVLAHEKGLLAQCSNVSNSMEPPPDLMNVSVREVLAHERGLLAQYSNVRPHNLDNWLVKWSPWLTKYLITKIDIFGPMLPNSWTTLTY